MNTAMMYQNNCFLGIGEPSKFRLLQSYEVLWIHVLDAICILRPSTNICQKHRLNYLIRFLLKIWEVAENTNKVEEAGFWQIVTTCLRIFTCNILFWFCHVSLFDERDWLIVNFLYSNVNTMNTLKVTGNFFLEFT